MLLLPNTSKKFRKEPAVSRKITQVMEYICGQRTQLMGSFGFSFDANMSDVKLRMLR